MTNDCDNDSEAIMHELPIDSSSVVFEPDGSLSPWRYEVPLFGGMSLENDIEYGDRVERALADTNTSIHIPVTVNNLPLSVFRSLSWLRVSCAGVNSFTAASRYATRCGARVLGRITALKELRKAGWDVYGRNIDAENSFFVNFRYDGFQQLSTDHVSRRLPVYRHRVYGELQEIAYEIGLPLSTIVLAAAVAGLAQSDSLVADSYRLPCALAIIRFCNQLETRVSTVRRILP